MLVGFKNPTRFKWEGLVGFRNLTLCCLRRRSPKQNPTRLGAGPGLLINPTRFVVWGIWGEVLGPPTNPTRFQSWRASTTQRVFSQKTCTAKQTLCVLWVGSVSIKNPTRFMGGGELQKPYALHGGSASLKNPTRFILWGGGLVSVKSCVFRSSGPWA